MFNDSEIIYEPGVNKDYEETDEYDYEPEIKLFKDSIFKSFMRYIIPKVSNEDSEYVVNRTKITHELSSSRNTTVTEHDILIVASILYKVDLELIEQLI